MTGFVHQSCINLQRLSLFEVQLLIIKVVFTENILVGWVLAAVAVEDEFLTPLWPPLQELVLDCLTLAVAGDPRLTQVLQCSTWFYDVLWCSTPLYIIF
jgi:hypothetical protein